MCLSLNRLAQVNRLKKKGCFSVLMAIFGPVLYSFRLYFFFAFPNFAVKFWVQVSKSWKLDGRCVDDKSHCRRVLKCPFLFIYLLINLALFFPLWSFPIWFRFLSCNSKKLQQRKKNTAGWASLHLALISFERNVSLCAAAYCFVEGDAQWENCGMTLCRA